MPLTLKRDNIKIDSFFGNFFEFSKSPLQFLQKTSEEFKSISSFKILNHNIVHIFEPQLLNHIINVNPTNYTQSNRVREQMKLLFGNSLITSDGQLWERQRKLLEPVFKVENILPFIRKIVNCNKQLLESLNLQNSNTNINNEFIDINQISSNLLNNIMGQILLSSEINHEVTIIGNLLLNLKADTFNRLKRPVLPLWVPTSENSDYNHKKHLVENIINKLINKRKKDDSRPNDLLSLLIDLFYEDTKEAMDDKQLRDEIISIYASGHEAIASTLSFALYLIYTHPEIEEKFNQEIDLVLGDKEPSFQDLKSLKYTMQIIQETLRLYPPVWIYAKKALNDDCISGYKIKKGDNIIYSPYIIHHDKKNWQEPETFEPDRFAPENIKSINPLSYLPFGANDNFYHANTNTLVLTILQISLVMIGQKYRFNLKHQHSLQIDPHITLKAKNGIMMSVQAIK